MFNIVEADDWIGIYDKNDILIFENHDISLIGLFKLLDIEHQYFFIEDSNPVVRDLFNKNDNRFPKNFSQIKVCIDETEEDVIYRRKIIDFINELEKGLVSKTSKDILKEVELFLVSINKESEKN